MKLIGTKAAAERLSITQQRIQALIREDRLPALLVGRDYVIKENDLKLAAVRKIGRPAKTKKAA